MHNSDGSFSKPSPAARSFSVIAALTVAMAMIVLAPAARAQTYGPSFAIDGFAGYNIASDLYNGYNGLNGTGSLELKNGFMWGGRAVAFTNQYTAVEFVYTRNGSDLAVKTSAGSAIPSDFDAGSLTADQYDLNFLVSQPTGNPKLWPYFTIGFGWTLTHPDVQAVNSVGQSVTVDGNSLFAFNMGLGTMVEMNPKLALRLDARWRVTDTAITTSSGVYCDYWGYCWSYASDWYNSGELTAGLSYRLQR